MKNKSIKYGILIFLGFLTLKRNIHFGDYCSGMPDGIQWIVFCLIFIIATIILIAKNKYDSRIYLIVLTTIILNLTLKPIINFSFSNKPFMIGSISNNSREKQITLNKNKSFTIKLEQPEWSCYKKGNYEIKDNILTLKKDNLIQETDSLFTYRYKIDLKNKILIPLEQGFKTILIESTNSQINK